MPSLAHAYRYRGPSAVVERTDGALGCRLVADHEGLFRGRVAHARATALALRTLSRTVMARFYIPPNVLLPMLDPVVTVGRATLRFEGFSGCCSTYARLDLDEAAFADVEERTPGTTNVDFQAPMRAALARVRDATPLLLEVGQAAVALDTGDEQVVERKVKFPLRWLKGLGEVQAFLSRMRPAFEVSAVEALRLVRSLPRTTRHEAFVEPIGRGLRVAMRMGRRSVRVHGVERLKLLEELLPLAKGVTVFAEDSGASAWQVELPGQRLTLVLSPERWRGFSGEGQLLSTLARRGDDAEAVLQKVRAALRWQDAIEPAELARDAGVAPDVVDEALAMLASRGLVGFDLVQGRWFHRELPFDLERVEALHPRLADARKLVDAGAVALDDDASRATVQSGGVAYAVLLAADPPSCTCPWFGKHGGERGPCKHVLAAELLRENGEDG